MRLEGLALPLVLICAYAAQAQVTAEDYARAEQFLPWNQAKLVLNAQIRPQWTKGGDRFTYRKELPDGAQQFILVDPAAGTATPTSDHAGAAPAKDSAEVESPDKKWVAFARNHNLYLRSKESGKETALTMDGASFNDYAGESEANTHFVSAQLLGKGSFAAQDPPEIIWSPDSKRLVTFKLDQRKVREMYLLQSVPAGGAVRPVLHRYHYPLPGDPDVASMRLVAFDIVQHKKVDLKFGPLPATLFTPFLMRSVWWDEKGQRVYALTHDRFWKTLRLGVADATTGAMRTIIQETGTTYVETGVDSSGLDVSGIRVLKHGAEITWFSERDGWGHLYLYDGKTGRLKNRITSGSWVVRGIDHIDESGDWLYFSASGKEPGEDPYLKHLYRIHPDGSGLEPLTPEPGNHDVSFAESGHYFVDNISRADLPTVSVLRSSDGKIVLELEKADVTKLITKDWKPPEPFTAKAADGTTDLYGLIFRPANFDPAKRYPVLDSVYPGPQGIRTPKTFPGVMAMQAQDMAELGFIVLMVDGRGTPLRSKAFHDYSYGKLGTAGGLEDHVAAIRALAGTRPYMDLDRVGIYGHSGGGFAAARAILAFPDFYKVAVASAGVQDQRGYLAEWGEKYEGPMNGDNYLENANPRLAANLKGKLLLAWGDMDDNVPSSLSVRLVSALIKANRNFDTLVMPNRNHGFANDPYFTRRRWDYLVRHLLGAQPPDYEVKTSPPQYRTLDLQ